MMKNRLLMGLGVLLVVVGIVWTLQGLGHLAGSAMTGVPTWAFVGPAVAVVGLAMLTTGIRGRRSAP